MSAIDSGERGQWPAWTVGHRLALGPREGLTAKQEAVLAMFENAWLAREPMPTYRELAVEFGLSCTNAVWAHVRPLRKKGWIDWEPGKARSIRLTDKAKARLRADGERGADANR